MTQYNTLNVGCLTHKWKSGKKVTKVTLNLLSYLIGSSNDETKFSHKSLLSDT